MKKWSEIKAEVGFDENDPVYQIPAKAVTFVVYKDGRLIEFTDYKEAFMTGTIVDKKVKIRKKLMLL